MPAPIKHTCPDIDKYIKYIKMAMVKDRDLQHMTEKELYDTASAMNSELESCIDYLEQMRSSNAQLRDWGQEMESDLNAANDSITHLEEKFLEPSK